MALDITTKTLKESPATQCWRLIYDATTKKIKLNAEMTGVTRTIDELFCAATKAEIDAEIASLGLIAPMPITPKALVAPATTPAK